MNSTSARCAQLLVTHSLSLFASKYSRAPHFRRLVRELLPYAAIPRSDGQHILLNRNYKPLGLPSDGRQYDYNSPEFLMCSMPIDPARADELVSTPLRDGSGLVRFFYTDTAPPWASPASLQTYRETLARALGLLGVA